MSFKNLVGRNSQKCFKALLTVFTCFLFGTAEEVCDVQFADCPEDFNGTTVTVPDNIISLASDAYACDARKIIENISDSSGPPSIMFVIDHSASMLGTCNTYPGNDTSGARFRVTRDFLDTIYKKHPTAEVGMVVFREGLYFDYTNNPLFTPMPGFGNQSYLPLMKLNAQMSNGKNGIQNIKDILQTERKIYFNPLFQIQVPCIDLVYKPNFQTIGNTNINTAFDAAKEAFKKATYPKANHFIVFLSDGEPHPLDPSQQGGKDPFYFVQGIDIPTTFTVYFNPADTAPQSLKDMTANIKKNGYSSNNRFSDLWTMKTVDYDTLMKLLVKKFVNGVLIVNTLPVKMVVNNSFTSTTFVKDFFIFPNRFPFQTTDLNTFKFDISYSLINQNTGQTWDTVTHPTVSFKREKNAPMPQHFKKICWSRSMQFFYNGQLVQTVNETMKDVEIRFGFDPGEAKYYYTNATVELTNKNGSSKDIEQLTLVNNNFVFSKSFPQEIKQANPGDGILQHGAEDSIIAIFRNPELPLDTLRAAVPFKVSHTIEVMYGAYFDRNADGYIDSIPLTLQGTFAPEDLDEFAGKLTLPEFRGFVINSKMFTSTGVALLVNETKTIDPITAVTANDSIFVTQAYLSKGGWVLPRHVPIVDMAAPVIVKAFLLDFKNDSLTDTLTVRFSEPVKRVAPKIPTPFFYKKPATGLSYTADLKFVYANNEEDIATFAVLSIHDLNNLPVEAMEKGDSIWINCGVGDNVFDKPGNLQSNPLNIRRVLDTKVLNVPFNFTIQATSPFILNKNNNIPNFITAIPVIKTYVEQNNFEIKDGFFQGITILIKPDNPNNMTKGEILEGTIALFDAVGNKIIKDAPLGFFNGNGDKNNLGLYFVWNCRNKNSRIVGTGTYLAVAKFFRVDENKQIIEKIIKKVFIGVGRITDNQ